MLNKRHNISQQKVLTLFINPLVILLIMSLLVVIGQYQLWASADNAKIFTPPLDKADVFTRQNKVEALFQPIIFESTQRYQGETTINEGIPAESGDGRVYMTESPLNAFSRFSKQKKVESRFQSIIFEAAQRHQVDPAIIKAIIMAESGFNPKAVSSKGARGLMQLMPRTAKYLGVQDSFDPEHNIHGGVRYFKRLLDRFDCDVELALAAYNAGSRNVRKYEGVPPFRATRAYIKKVLAYYEAYKNDSKDLQA